MNLLSQSRIYYHNVGRLCISPNNVVTSTVATSRTLSTRQWTKFMGVLKVNKDSSPKDIKDSFLRLSKLYHPDNKVTGSHLKFVELKEAYDALKDGHPRQTTSTPSGNHNPYDYDVSYDAHRRYRDRVKDYQTAYEKGYGFGGPYYKSSTPWEDLMKDREFRKQKRQEYTFSEKGGRPSQLMRMTVVFGALAWIVIYSGVLLVMSVDGKVKRGLTQNRPPNYEDYVAYKEYLKKKETARILQLEKLQTMLDEDPVHQSKQKSNEVEPVVAR